MFCSKCGENVEKKVKFCPKCGAKLVKEESDATIVFQRKKQFYGVLIPVKIYLDGKLVGSVKSNESITVETTVGNHRLAFNLWSGNGQYDINITKENPNVRVNLKLSMGLVTSKPKIINIENI